MTLTLEKPSAATDLASPPTPCVCAPSRMMWWRYPMPKTNETVGIWVLLTTMIIIDIVLLIALGVTG